MKTKENAIVAKKRIIDLNSEHLSQAHEAVWNLLCPDLPEHLKIPLLKPNETATFRLVGSGRINPKKNDRADDEGWAVHAWFTVTQKSYTNVIPKYFFID